MANLLLPEYWSRICITGITSDFLDVYEFQSWNAGTLAGILN